MLVSTTVIEVGINVPNATVMMVENAERFGLAQLHQLRGRIGRGKSQSYCIFIDGAGKEKTTERLKILNSSNDGFYIAEEDLKLRGPGTCSESDKAEQWNLKSPISIRMPDYLRKSALRWIICLMKTECWKVKSMPV